LPRLQVVVMVKAVLEVAAGLKRLQLALTLQ
jgi:hypothetical protein